MTELNLDLLEAQILARSHDTAVTRRRTVITMFTGCAVAVGFIVAAMLGLSVRAVAGIAAAYALVTMLERVFHGRAILGYKSLIRKLTEHIADLEQPV
jgi:asparagine N-glycosylation enzyme membrane subunit Stt3